MVDNLLSGVRVVEIDAGIAGAYCTSLLAGLGADVVLVEPGGGDALRRLPPLGGPDGQSSLSFSYLATGKSSVPAGPGVDGLLSRADILVTRGSSSQAPDPRRSSRELPHLVTLDISAFGPVGPYADLPDVELLVSALGGWLYGLGEPGREPLKAPHWQTSVLAGTLGAAAALGAFLGARDSGLGDRVELSRQAAVAWFLMNPTTVYAYSGAVWERDGGVSPSNYPQGLMQCRDGPIGVNVMYYAEWDRFCDLMGHPEWRTDPRLATPILRLQHRDIIDEVLRPWLSTRSVAEAVEEAQRHKLPFAPVASPHVLLEDPHLAARSFWQTVDQPGIGPIRQPGMPFRLAGARPHAARPAPVRGSSSVGEVFRRWSRRVESAPGWRRPGVAAVAPDALPLRGVRVVDLTMAWAGPMATRVLAELGADVIKVETASRMDRWRGGTTPQRGLDRYPGSDPGDRPWERNAFFNTQNTNKQAISLNLKTAEGRRLLLELVQQSTILVENFGSGAMSRLGLDYEVLAEKQPHLVMVSMPAFGRTGPNREFIAHGPTIEAAAGNVALQGYRDEDPLPSGAFAWGDPVAGVNGAFAALAGLTGLALHGRGGHIDLSHVESGIPFNFPAFLEAATGGAPPRPQGNTDPTVPFQAVLACSGRERWVALAATSDRGIRALAGLVGADDAPGLDVLEKALARWTGSRTTEEVTTQCRSLPDVGAAPVHDAADLSTDPALHEFGFYRDITHPEAGTHQYPGMPWRHDLRPWRTPLPAPLFGAHTSAVLTEVLGRAEDEVHCLHSQGVIATEPTLQGD